MRTRILILMILGTMIGCTSARQDSPCARYSDGDIATRRACFIERVREFAGPGAAFCGDMRAQPPSPIVLECAITRFEAKRPFVMIEWVPGIDSELANAWILRSDGSFFLLHYDDLYAETIETAMREPSRGTALVGYKYGRAVFEFEALAPR